MRSQPCAGVASEDSCEVRITRLEAIPVTVRFRHPFVVWRGTVESKGHVVVLVHTDDGRVGVGEAAPFLQYAAETPEDVQATLERYLAPLLEGFDPFDLEKLGAMFAHVLEGHNFSKSAVEMALWDLIGQKLDVPLYQLLGGRVREALEIAVVLRTGPPDEAAREARERVGQGFSALKLKLGFGLEEDVERVRRVREGVGTGVTIRVDPEESYNVKSALGLARALEPQGVELISQPVPRTAWDDMRLLRERLTVPLLADECIITPEDVLYCARVGAADAINIKVSKSGGLLNARRMAAIAQAAGLPCLLGSMLELGPGTAFAAHFGVSNPAVSWPCEIQGPILLESDGLECPLRIEHGRLWPPDGPGLGIKLELDRLRTEDRGGLHEPTGSAGASVHP
jgi:L-alanine-DL-glutamate epimerase-like enolase superfamily enzyme